MNWDTKNNQLLLKTVLSLKNEDEARRFLRDLMTETEIDEFARRLSAANMLYSGIAYTIVTKETGLSSTTIARVAKYLNGSEGGYKLALDRLHHIQPNQRSGLS